MAGLYGVCAVQDIAVTGGTPLCVIAVNPPDANTRARITKLIVSTDGTNSANTPIRVDLCRGSAGTFSSGTNAPVKLSDPTGSLETLRMNYKKTCTVNPTQLEIMETYRLPAFGGTIVEPFAPGQEPIIYGSATYYVYVLITAAQSVNVTVSVMYEE